MGRLEEAHRFYEHSLTVCREIGHWPFAANAIGNLGSVELSLGRHEEAVRRFEEHLKLCREIEDREGEGRALGNMGNVLLQLGRFTEAREKFTEALGIHRETGDALNEGIYLTGVVRALQEEGETDLAMAEATKGLGIADKIGARHLSAMFHLSIALLQADYGRLQDAGASLKMAHELAGQAGMPGLEARILCELAVLPDGDSKAALESLSANKGSMGDQELIEIHWALWKATKDPDHLREAKRLLDEALGGMPEADRERVTERVRTYRGVLEAWSAVAEGPPQL
jgi:tetratricopeptide (TPR) repeat protein